MASQLLGIKTRFTNDLGSPLLGGQVYTYFAGTSTNQDSYSDAALIVPNTNPVILDDTGSADIFLKGSYRIRVFDKSGRFIEEQDNVTQAANQGDATQLTNKINAVESGLDAANTEINKVKFDTGITVTAKTNGVARLQVDKNAEIVTAQDFGAVGDGVADDTLAIQKAMDYAAANKVKLHITKGTFKITSYLLTKTNLHMVFDNGAWILPYAWSPTGAILTNVSKAAAARTQSDVTIENPQMDGQHLPYSDKSSNDNAIGLGLGMTRARVVGGHIKNFQYNFNGVGAGGKAINFEAGTYDSCTEGTLFAENCGVAVFVQGSSVGNTSRIQIGNIIAQNCDSAFIGLGIDTTNDPTGSPSRQFVHVGNIMAYNCGHAPYRPVNGYQQQKSGIVVFGEGQNITIDSITAYNDSTYPMSIGYPTVESGLVGGGLTGAVGAVIWGWGRNIHVGTVTYHGDCDYLVYFGRARAVGDDAAPSTYPVNCFNFNINQFNHIGTATYVVGLQSNMPIGTVTGNLRNIQTDTITSLVTAQGDRHKDLFLKVTRKDGYEVSGRLSTLFARYNAIGAFVPTSDITMARSLSTDGLYGNSVQTIADDGRYLIVPERKQGFVIVSSQNSLLNFMFSYRINDTPQISIIGAAPGQVAALPQGLDGTTGVDGNFTVGCNNATLYFENRRGAQVSVNITYFG